jgi:hypothetical protein
MNDQRNYIRGLLYESWFDITEEYEELMQEWYGDPMAVFDPEDADLTDVVRACTKSYRYWHFDPNQMTSFERLRMAYDVLVQAHVQLSESYQELLSAYETPKKANDADHIQISAIKIKGGCIRSMERRIGKTNEDAAA